MIFHSYKTIMFHIGKTAGHSIENAFDPSNRDPYIPNHNTFFGLDSENRLYLQHATPKFMKACIPAEVFDAYYKFTIVRNPFSRIISVYHYDLENLRKKHGNFEGFVSSIHNEYRSEVALRGRHPTEQINYTHIDDNLACNFVGSFENLPVAFQNIQKNTGLKNKLDHHNSNPNGVKTMHQFKEFLTPSIVSKIQNLYLRDFNTYGYSLDPEMLFSVPNKLHDCCTNSRA